jgi:hypothetical protein
VYDSDVRTSDGWFGLFARSSTYVLLISCRQILTEIKLNLRFGFLNISLEQLVFPSSPHPCTDDCRRSIIPSQTSIKKNTIYFCPSNEGSYWPVLKNGTELYKYIIFFFLQITRYWFVSVRLHVITQITILIFNRTRWTRDCYLKHAWKPRIRYARIIERLSLVSVIMLEKVEGAHTVIGLLYRKIQNNHYGTYYDDVLEFEAHVRHAWYYRSVFDEPTFSAETAKVINIWLKDII